MNTIYRLVLISCCFLIVMGFVADAYDPEYDCNSDGEIECTDLFGNSTRWVNGQENEMDEEGLLDMMKSWHTTGDPQATATPTATPGSGEERVVNIPELFPVNLEGTSFPTGEAHIPIQLSEVNGLKKAELWFPAFFQSDHYSVIVGDPTLTGLTAGFSMISEVTFSQGFEYSYRYVIIESDEAITESGAGDLFSLMVSVYPLGEGPYSPEVVDFGFTPDHSDLRGSSNIALAHRTEDGSLQVNPPGAGETYTPTPTSGEPTVTPTPTLTGQPTHTPSPTETQGVPTPTYTQGLATETPTLTQTPSGAGDRLQIMVCEPQEIAGNSIYVYVDVLDGEGHIVNPGVEGGGEPRQVTLTVDGSASFPENQGAQNYTTMLEDPDGLRVTIDNLVAEKVTVTAGAPGGLGDAEPVELEWIEGGKISGAVQVWDNDAAAFRAANMGEVMISVYIPNATTSLSSTMTQFTGNYEVGAFIPGTYDVSFTPQSFGLFSSSTDLQPVCVTGVVVTAGETTENVDAELPERVGHRIYGTITADDGATLVSGMVTLNPADSGHCGTMIYMEQAVVSGNNLIYDITNIPDGEYFISGSAFAASEEHYSSGQTESVTVSGQDLQKDLEVLNLPMFNVHLISPLHYARTPNPPTFEWSIPEEAPEMVYMLTVYDRCGIAWQQSDIEGTSVEYGGETLQKNHIYQWFVVGFATDGSASAMYLIAEYAESHFVVE